ncbi:MAG: ORF6N domain-containing protein [Blastocatellia bacterium]|nr:ORF6N domain-containing protein [Blastocatellia bacterium]
MTTKFSNQQNEQSLTLQQINNHIYTIRGQKVMLDEDLAELYGVETKVFNQAVKRNLDRFPEDFMFRLTEKEYNSLRSQIVTSNEPSSLRSQSATSSQTKGGRRYMPYGFTEQGVAMLSSVLNSKKAIQINISIMRTFVKMRDALINNQKETPKLFPQNPRKTSIDIIPLASQPLDEPFLVSCDTYNYKEAMAFMEHNLLLRIIKESAGNINKSVQISGFPKTTLYRLIRKHGLKLSPNLMLVS